MTSAEIREMLAEIAKLALEARSTIVDRYDEYPGGILWSDSRQGRQCIADIELAAVQIADEVLEKQR